MVCVGSGVPIGRYVRPDTFGRFRLSPEQFLTEASRLINEEKATAVIEHLSYDPLQDSFDTAIFTDNKVNLSRVGDKLTRHIYDYAITDSTAEQEFAVELDTSDEDVKDYRTLMDLVTGS